MKIKKPTRVALALDIADLKMQVNYLQQQLRAEQAGRKADAEHIRKECREAELKQIGQIIQQVADVNANFARMIAGVRNCL